MTNNARKRKHLVKCTRHWKMYLKLKLNDTELEYAFEDVKATTELFNRLMNELIDQCTERINGYGYIKEDKPII